VGVVLFFIYLYRPHFAQYIASLGSWVPQAMQESATLEEPRVS
jgi:hypothetical protein